MSRWPVSPVDYLLGELPPEERSAAERLAAADPAFRAEVERLRPVVSTLDALPAEAWAPVEPPPLRAMAADDPRAVHAPRPPRERLRDALSRRLVLRPAVALAACAARLAGGVGLGLAVSGGGSGGSAPITGASATLGALSQPAARGEVRMTTGPDQRMEIVATGLRPTRAGDYYELWLLGGPGRMVPVGTFRVTASRHADVRFQAPVPTAAYRFVDLSLQHAGAGPAHSGDSVLRARIA